MSARAKNSHAAPRIWPLAVHLVIALAVAACSGGPASSAVTSTPEARSSPSASTVLTSGSLKVVISSPADETVVSVPSVDVIGQAPSDTVITVNDAIAVVNESGQFFMTVPLDEGPNDLAILASDAQGNQASARLIVTYDPSS